MLTPPRDFGGSRHAWLLPPLILLCIYAVSVVGAHFRYDDFHHIVSNAHAYSVSNIGAYFTDASYWSVTAGRMYRPVELALNAVDFEVWGLRPSGWVLTNLFLHIVAAYLVGQTARALELSTRASWIASLVFGLHPVASEVVNYVSARTESIAASLLLSAILLHRRGCAEQSAGKARVYEDLARASCCAAVFAKETAALFWLIIPVIDLYVERDSPGVWSRVLRRAGVYFIVFCGVLTVRQLVLSEHLPRIPVLPVETGSEGKSLLGNAVTQSRVGILYLQMLVKPVRQCIDHDVAYSGILSRSVIAALSVHCLAGLLVVALWFRGRRLPLLCAALFILMLLPSIALPLNVVMNEHRLYLPLFAFSVLTARVMDAVLCVPGPALQRAVSRGAVASVLCTFGTLTLFRNVEWTSETGFWETAAGRSPRSAIVRGSLAFSLLHDSRTQTTEDQLRTLGRATTEYEQACALDPQEYAHWLGKGAAWTARFEATRDERDRREAVAAFAAAGAVHGCEYDPEWQHMLGMLTHDVEDLTVVADILAATSTSRRFQELARRVRSVAASR